MYVKTITDNKKQYIDLLLLADEQENMIDKYLERGILFAFFAVMASFGMGNMKEIK